MSSVTRRRFLGGALAAAVALRLKGSGRASGPPVAKVPGSGPVDVAWVKGGDPTALVAKALAALGGIERFVKKGARVAIKPNLAFANPPDWGTSTDPALILAVARACLGAGAVEVLIVENPLSPPKRALERTGMQAALAAEKDGRIRIQMLSKDEEFETIDVPGGKVLRRVAVARALRSADLVVNMPIIKSHGGARVSGALKNGMGAILDRHAFHADGLDACIADLARVYRPGLTVADATRSLVTHGPGGPGDTVRPGVVLAGTDMVAIDACAVGLARWNGKRLAPRDLGYLRMAAEAGLGQIDVAKLKIARLEA